MEKLYSVDVVKIRISEALAQLISTRPFDSISVTDIMDEAQMSRATFYRHFSTKEEVIAYYFDRLAARFKLNRTMDFSTYDNAKRSVEMVLDAIKKNKKILGKIVAVGCGDIILRYVDMQLEKPYVESGVRVPLGVYIYSGAIYNLTLKWIMEDCATDISELTSMIMLSATNGSMFNL